MNPHPQAGHLPTEKDLVHIPSLMAAYYTLFPDLKEPSQQVSFGTSGHRGSSLQHTFNEQHICAITQAVCDYRQSNSITGPLFLGMDTHALSEAACRTALEVLVGNGVQVFIAKDGAYTPTPAVSRAILRWNKGKTRGFADGIIITPSHNPPQDGGFKYNPPHGGPAESTVTKQIEKRANEILCNNNNAVARQVLCDALTSPLVREHDFIQEYVNDLSLVLNMEAIAAAGIRLGVNPLGGASLAYWEPIAERYKLSLTMVNKTIDPTFRFVPCDKDGKIRMDCSSPYAMKELLNTRSDFDISFGCDPDSDRHGIVTPDGLMNPNHYLSVAVWHLFRHRPQWSATTAVGKTLVTSSMLDRVAAALGRNILEVPVGFKWFVPGLLEGTCGIGCEESAGASFLCHNGEAWTTDKDGLLLCLLSAEIMATEGKSPSVIYKELTERFGTPYYQRTDSPAEGRTRELLLGLDGQNVHLTSVGNSPVTNILTKATGNNESIGGVKVVTEDGWFAARPSGTEAVCKVYAESFKSEEHLHSIQADASHFMQQLVTEKD